MRSPVLISNLACHVQIALMLRCFSMGDELVRSAALLFTRSADLEANQWGLSNCNNSSREFQSMVEMFGRPSLVLSLPPASQESVDMLTSVMQDRDIQALHQELGW